MNMASTRTYRENRAKFPLNELRKRDGQWVAFSPDGQRIVASTANISETCRPGARRPKKTSTMWCWNTLK